MNGQSQIEIHQLENNTESQSFLIENAQKFSNKCLEVLRLLYTGKRLTVLEAANMGISSLPRRCLDIRRDMGDNSGFEIRDEWVRDAKGKRLYKEYYINISQRPTKEETIKRFSTAEFIQQKLL